MRTVHRRATVASLAIVLLATATGCSATRGEDTASGSGSGEARTSCDENGVSQGITDDTIKLGSFTPLTGPVADPGTSGLAGLQYAIDTANADGGIDGRQIELVVEDDQYDASVALQAARRLNESDEVFAFTGGIGTPNFVGVLPYIKQNAIPAVGPYAPSNQVGVMENPDVFMIWPNFVDEFDVAVSWMMENEPVESASLVQQVGDVGDDALAGIEKALDGTGVELSTIQTVEPTTTDFSAIAQALRNADSEMVMFIAGPVVVGQVIQAMHQIGYEPRLLGQSDMTDESWLSEFGDEGEGMIVATKVAPFGSDDPLVQQFVDDWTADNGEAPTMWNAAGYTQGLVTIEALKTAPALTRDCFEFALETMSDFETGLIPPVTFGPDSRQGTNAVGVAKIEDGEVVQVAPFQLVSGD
ncbi:amino acid/amide ABC transporter substrate-binding protein (HAAT family) [Labedella gwakjiensis]|nr:ABC transporter substrate-binding protein [Labedella gwakjiensis]PSL38339.1 amino acid/amide ABC transporter substrate-binding protein (HAAT family) [Labedella gwakjiensis]